MAARGAPVDYGVPAAGLIRFLTVPPGTCGPWYIQTIVSHDRTLKEWLQLIAEWKGGTLPEKYDQPLESGNPFTTRRAAAVFLTELVAREMRLRWLARKVIARLRERIYARRVVGADCDLYTTEAVPEYARIYVRDRASRSLYCFHVRTITSVVVSALAYNHYGIACPQPPKNPYTNKPWTTVQLMSITSQILAYHINGMRNRLPMTLLKFRKCGHDVATYFMKYTNELMIAGARNFFKDVMNPDRLETCGDLMDDLYEEVGVDICNGWRIVKTIVLGRMLDVHLLARWDKLLCSAWIFMNFQKNVGFETWDAILDEFNVLHERSYAWWNAQPKRILARPLPESDSESDSKSDI